MSETRRTSNLFKVEGAKLIFKNFAGKGSDYNNEGDRNFGVLISDEDAEMLKDDGWNVKYLRPREDDPTNYRQPWLPVKVKFNNYPPTIYIIIPDEEHPRKVRLGEETVEQLDWTAIEFADLVIRPYNYPATPLRQAGVSAYLKAAYITIHQDDLEKKYGSIPEEGDMDEYDD